MKHIKRLAQHVLDQRTDLERFFMDALAHVRENVQKEKESRRKLAQADYNKRMRDVLSQKTLPYPAVQSFRPQPLPHAQGSTHAIAQALLRPPTGFEPPPPSSKVDIADLLWTDKERVLRLLFAKMNGVALVKDGPTGDEVEYSGTYSYESSYIESASDGYAPPAEGEYESSYGYMREVDIDEPSTMGVRTAEGKEGMGGFTPLPDGDAGEGVRVIPVTLESNSNPSDEGEAAEGGLRPSIVKQGDASFHTVAESIISELDPVPVNEQSDVTDEKPKSRSPSRPQSARP
ncbi:hypothetical protein HDV05_002656, partial [Chytridiales sp. JEL 0842]